MQCHARYFGQEKDQKEKVIFTISKESQIELASIQNKSQSQTQK